MKSYFPPASVTDLRLIYSLQQTSCPPKNVLVEEATSASVCIRDCAATGLSPLSTESIYRFGRYCGQFGEVYHFQIDFVANEWPAIYGTGYSTYVLREEGIVHIPVVSLTLHTEPQDEGTRRKKDYTARDMMKSLTTPLITVLFCNDRNICVTPLGLARNGANSYVGVARLWMAALK